MLVRLVILAVGLSLALACYANPRIWLNNKEALSDCDSGEGPTDHAKTEA